MVWNVINLTATIGRQDEQTRAETKKLKDQYGQLMMKQMEIFMGLEPETTAKRKMRKDHEKDIDQDLLAQFEIVNKQHDEGMKPNPQVNRPKAF